MFLWTLDRAEKITSEQPVYVYELNVKTKMFHEEPFKNGAQNIRKEFCRSDHFDDVMYVFGFGFIQDLQFQDKSWVSSRQHIFEIIAWIFVGKFEKNFSP